MTHAFKWVQTNLLFGQRFLRFYENFVQLFSTVKILASVEIILKALCLLLGFATGVARSVCWCWQIKSIKWLNVCLYKHAWPLKTDTKPSWILNMSYFGHSLVVAVIFVCCISVLANIRVCAHMWGAWGSPQLSFWYTGVHPPGPIRGACEWTIAKFGTLVNWIFNKM